MSSSVGEPPDLLAAYKAALDATATPPCAPLLKLLEDAVENDVPIATLNLREAGLGAAGAAALAAMLKRDSFMTYANLEENDLGDEGVTHIAEALCTHESVFRLDLGYNKVRARPTPTTRPRRSRPFPSLHAPCHPGCRPGERAGRQGACCAAD